MINEIHERLDKIKFTPWKHDGLGIYIFGNDSSMIAEIRGWGHLTGKLNLPHNEAVSIQSNTADFIAHAPEDIAFLLDEVERQEERLDEMEAELQKYWEAEKVREYEKWIYGS